MLKRILEKISDSGALMFPPVAKSELEAINLKLKEHGVAEIPVNYANLLTATDGFVWDGMEFYGLGKKTRENYLFPDLEMFNLSLKSVYDIENKLLLGRTAEAIFVFDAKSGRYNVVNRIDFSVIDSFTNLSDALYLYVEGLFE